jgi:hypothetical protein
MVYLTVSGPFPEEGCEHPLNNRPNIPTATYTGIQRENPYFPKPPFIKNLLQSENTKIGASPEK